MLFHIMPFGDTGLRIQFGEEISVQTNQWIRSFAALLEQEKIPGVVEWIPTYTAISISYDPYVVSYVELKRTMLYLKQKLAQIELPPPRMVVIPTCYGGEKGPDLAQVASHHGLTEEEVVTLHSEVRYLIYMMGFTPGFPYLGGMSTKIATPRQVQPRAKVPAGSVGIAGEQTGVYPLQSPGGWQLIGQTPVKLYDPNREPPILLKAGDYLKFIPISREEYEEITQQVQQGTYEPHVKDVKSYVREDAK